MGTVLIKIDPLIILVDLGGNVLFQSEVVFGKIE